MAEHAQEKDSSTEEKIKEAARILFSRKGFSATTTRDIAKEAGINLALLNYYFRSKEKLYDQIMSETIEQFVKGISLLFINEELSTEVKTKQLVNTYTDLLNHFPDMPLFVLGELKDKKSRFRPKMEKEIGDVRWHFIRQLQDSIGTDENAPLHGFHIFANMLALTIFPYLAAPILQKLANVNETEFKNLMQERKALIPVWLKAMYKEEKESKKKFGLF